MISFAKLVDFNVAAGFQPHLRDFKELPVR